MHTLFIHGLGQTASSWDETISFMPGKDKVSCPDLWKLVWGKNTTYTNIYDSFVAYCESFPDKLNLCGLSLGALIALNYTIDYPDRVDSLVLIAPQYKIPKRIMKFQNIFFRLLPKGVFLQMGLPKKNVLQLTNSMLDLDFTAKLKRVSCRTLLICGANDHANKKATNQLAQILPNAEIQIIEGAGHVVNTEKGKELAIVLGEFWNH